MSDDDDIPRRLERLANAERPETVEFIGPGPYELPRCGKQVSLRTLNDQHFVLELQTEQRSQRLLLPISTQALPALTALLRHASDNLGLDKTRH